MSNSRNDESTSVKGLHLLRHIRSQLFLRTGSFADGSALVILPCKTWQSRLESFTQKKTKSIPNEQVGTSVQLRAMENDCRTLVVNLFRVVRMEIASRCIIVNLSESAQYSTKYLRRDEQNPFACRQHNVYSHPIYSFPEHFVCLNQLTDTSISCTQALVPTRSKRPDSVGIVLN
jgi:hypothetical protein